MRDAKGKSISSRNKSFGNSILSCDLIIGSSNFPRVLCKRFMRWGVNVHLPAPAFPISSGNDFLPDVSVVRCHSMDHPFLSAMLDFNVSSRTYDSSVIMGWLFVSWVHSSIIIISTHGGDVTVGRREKPGWSRTFIVHNVLCRMSGFA